MRSFLLSAGLLVCSLVTVAVATFGDLPVVFPVTLTWGKGSPDGFEREMIFVNGQFPGPTLHLSEGDDVEFIVYNSLPFSITVHFHGIDQIDTPWSDGVPGLSQRKIEAGESFKYKWTATSYGTYWYHGHVQGQLADGLFGPILIQPAKNIDTPFRMISNSSKDIQQLEYAMRNPEIAVVSDWSHFTSDEILDIYTKADIDAFCGDSMLINGKGNVNCPGAKFLTSLVPAALLPTLMGQELTDKGCPALANDIYQTNFPHDLSVVPYGLFVGCNATKANPYVFNVDASQGWVSLNIISTASVQEMIFSVDEHPLWVYSIDGRFIEPQRVDALTLQHGSRHTVMVQLNKPKKDYTIRVAGGGANQKIFVSGLLSYNQGRYSSGGLQKASVPYINYAGVNTTANVTFLNDAAVVPYPPVHPAQHADQTVKLLLNRTGTAYEWTLSNNMPFNLSLEDIEPLLFNPEQLQNSSLVISTKNGTWVDLILIATASGGVQPAHPIHKHSNKAHIIGSGTGEFTWNNVAEAIKDIPSSFNLDNPSYRDGFYTLPVIMTSTWMVVRYQVINPGPFFLHCHIDTHLTGGMGIAILDGIDVWPKVPEEYRQGRNGF